MERICEPYFSRFRGAGSVFCMFGWVGGSCGMGVSRFSLLVVRGLVFLRELPPATDGKSLVRLINWMVSELAGWLVSPREEFCYILSFDFLWLQ